MFQEHDTIDAKEIARDYFGGSSATYIHQQRELGRFPAPSWITPGSRGRHVWLKETVDVWLAEYLARSSEVRKPRGKKADDRKAANDAAETATRIAENHDAKLRQAIINQRKAGSLPIREKSNVSSAQLVATA